jgi:hypothetical protein
LQDAISEQERDSMKAFFRVWLGISLIAIGLGIGLIIVSIASGLSWDDVYKETWEEHADLVNMSESYEGVENLDIDIDYGKVKIEQGTEFSISAENIRKDELKSYVEDGTWHIKEDNSRHYDFLGIDFHLGDGRIWNDHFAPRITVTLPEGFEASDFTLKVGAGSVAVDEVYAVKGNFSVDAGEIDINQLTISDESKYTVGTGKMTLSEAKVNNIIVDSGVGSVDINGEVNGENDIKCGVGSVNLNLDGTEEEYSYDVSCGIGNISIDGHSYKNIDGEVIDNDAADNSLKLDCGIGHISVDFN